VYRTGNKRYTHRPSQHPTVSAVYLTSMASLSPTTLTLRRLLLLVAVVLLAHWLVLSGHTTAWSVATGSPQAFSIRTITPEAAPEPARNLPPAPPAPIAATPPPVVAKKPPAKPITEPNRPPAQQSIAQAATETIATPEPVAEVKETATARVTPEETATSAPTTAASSSSSTEEVATQTPSRSPVLKFPASGKFSYNAIQTSGGQPRSGSGTLEWTTDGRDYELRLEASLLITLLSQTSAGALSTDGLEPKRFSDKRIRRSEKAAHFQRDSGRITFSANQTVTPLLRGAQDRLSILMQLAAMAAGDPVQFAQSGNVPVQVVGTDDAENWMFVVEGEESIQVPAGESAALRVVRNPRKEFDARLEVWLAPSLGYLPARIRQTESNGNVFELQLRSPALR
jgi:Protein of unknown function (DUF3108)